MLIREIKYLFEKYIDRYKVYSTKRSNPFNQVIIIVVLICAIFISLIPKRPKIVNSVDQQVTIKRKLTKRHRNIQEQHKKTAKKLIKTKTIIQTKTKHRGELCFTDNAQRLRHI